MPDTFLIGCDGWIYVKHTSGSSVSHIEQEIRPLLEQRTCAQQENKAVWFPQAHRAHKPRRYSAERNEKNNRLLGSFA